MRRLVAFGDSYTAGYGVSISDKWRGHGRPDDFENFYRRMNSWPRYVAEHFDIPYVNMGYCDNFGNRDIYNLIVDVFDELHDDDLILIAFSYPYRNETSPIEDYTLIDSLLSNHNRYYFNAFYPMFRHEIIDNIEINNFIDIDWSFADYLAECENERHDKPSDFLFEYFSKRDITATNDGSQHPSLYGYKKISEYVINSLTDKLK